MKIALHKELVQLHVEEWLNNQNSYILPTTVHEDYREWVNDKVVRRVDLLAMAAHQQKALADITYRIENMVGEDDWVFVSWSMTATHVGEYMGYPPTHMPIASTGMTVYRFKDCKIIEVKTLRDTLSLMQNLQQAAVESHLITLVGA